MKFKQWKTSVNDSIYYPLNENLELYFTKNVTKNMFPIPKALKRSKNRDISLLADNAVLEMLMENARSRIVALKPDTVQVLKQLNDQIFGPGSSDTMLANVLVEPNLTFMAFRNDVPVGLIDCTTFPTVNDRSSLLIKYLGVLPDYRRKGVAADLIKHMVQFAKNTEKLDSICTNLHLENNEPARKTFLGSGFVQSGTNPQTSGDVTVLVYAMNTNVNH
uniref:N-terminal methionine N(alpha)-acetyltransferase NatE n=1 Tax=Caenorhabditis tropicalis TaxID=1561998 RepID=A0A1I7U5R2_9PELO